MKKIVVKDLIGKEFEPYNRQFIWGEVAGLCHRNPSILSNPSMTSVWSRGYKDEAWEDHCKMVSCVSFEIDEITDAKWEFLQTSIGSWAVELEVLPDDWELTPISGFR